MPLAASKFDDPMDIDFVCRCAIVEYIRKPRPETSNAPKNRIEPPCSMAFALTPSIAVQRKKYITSPKRPARKGIDSKTRAMAETVTIELGMISAYCLAKTNGCSGASPRTRIMAMALHMKPSVNVARKTTLPPNLPRRYSRLPTFVEAMTKPLRDRASRPMALEMT